MEEVGQEDSSSPFCFTVTSLCSSHQYCDLENNVAVDGCRFRGRSCNTHRHFIQVGPEAVLRVLLDYTCRLRCASTTHIFLSVYVGADESCRLFLIGGVWHTIGAGKKCVFPLPSQALAHTDHVVGPNTCGPASQSGPKTGPAATSVTSSSATSTPRTRNPHISSSCPRTPSASPSAALSRFL